MMCTKKLACHQLVILFILLFFMSGCGEISGFKAKALCSNLYNADRDKESVQEDELTILLGLQHLFPEKIFHDERKVTAGLGLTKSTALFRDGLGATLLCDMTEETLMDQEVPDLTPLPLNQELLPWPTGDVLDDTIPGEVNEAKLTEAVEFAFTEPVQGERNRRTRAVVIVYDGVLVAEQYAEEDGFHADTRQIGWSMTKSVINALVGILAAQGKLDLHAPAPVPEWEDPHDPRHAITMDDLMRMSSGLKFNEELDVLFMIYGTDDTGAYAADRTLLAAPGSFWSYSSGSTNIVSRIIKNLFPALADNFSFPRRALFDKLGMRSAIIEPDGSGTLVGSSYMWATARDWARFGLLYLNNGLWEGERILPQGWVDYSTTPTPASGGLYGAYFWLNAANTLYPALPSDLYECRGFVGQMLTVIPSKKLVVVRLGFNPEIATSSKGYHEYEYWTNDEHQTFILKIMEAIEHTDSTE